MADFGVYEEGETGKGQYGIYPQPFLVGVVSFDQFFYFNRDFLINKAVPVLYFVFKNVFVLDTFLVLYASFKGVRSCVHPGPCKCHGCFKPQRIVGRNNVNYSFLRY